MFSAKAYPEFFSEGETLRVLLRGEIDHHSAAPLREEIDLYMERTRPLVLALDMAGVSFMDSSGLGLVLGRVSRGEEYGCRVEIWNADARILRILQMAGVSHIRNIKICERKAEREETAK